MKHRCKYKIIGTSWINADAVVVDGWVQVDLVCKKCGKTGTVYVWDDYEDKIHKQASKGKDFRVPIKCCLSEKQFINYIKEACY